MTVNSTDFKQLVKNPECSPVPAAPTKRPEVVFLNRSYWPDAEATGQLLTELCKDLTEDFEVTVVAGQPNQNPDRIPYRASGREIHQGVTIQRVWHTRFAKTSLLGRAINLLTYLFAVALASLRMERPSVVVVQTDPPLLCLLGAWLQWRHRCRLVIYLQDIYPDLAVALGKIRNTWLTRALRRWMFRVYRHADCVVVLSSDMREVLLEAGVSSDRIVTIPNWTDTSRIQPRKSANKFRTEHAPLGEFVVMYSGNSGLCQQLENVLKAAKLLRHRVDLRFLLIGDGASKKGLELLAQDLGLSNVRFLDYQPKSTLSESLSAADLHLVPLDPRIKSYLMPSKLYGILASQTPLVAVAPSDCELSRLVETEGVGCVVPPNQPESLAEKIEWCAANREKLAVMGHAARRLAVETYDRTICTTRFRNLLVDVLEPGADLGKHLPSPHTPAARFQFQKPEDASEVPVEGVGSRDAAEAEVGV